MVPTSSSSSRAPPLPLVLTFRDSLNWPTCPTSQISFQVLFNKRGQDPCTIALNLLKACDSHLEEDSTAFDVMAFQNSPCACNTVLYSLFNVCGQCAGRDDFETTTWNTFRHALNCAEPVNQAYIEAIPSDTAIPEWAYLPLGTDGKVDLTQAREAASQNEPDMTSPETYAPPLQSTGGASPMLTFAPTSDSTAPRSVSFTIATPTPSSDFKSEATVPRSTLPNSDNSPPSVSPVARMSPPVSSAVPSLPTQEIDSISLLPSTSLSALVSADSTYTTSITSAQASGMSALRRPVFIRASAGLSAAALITTIIAVLLFRRDRRITKAAKQARRARLNNIGEELALSPLTLRGPYEANLSEVQGLLRAQRFDPEIRGVRGDNANTSRPTPGNFDGRVWRA